MKEDLIKKIFVASSSTFMEPQLFWFLVLTVPMKRELQVILDGLYDIQDSESDQEFSINAEELFSSLSLESRIDYDAFLEYILSEHFAFQELNLHRSPRVIPLLETDKCRVMAHLWLDSVADLHTHEWSGAFQIVSGTAVHCQYQFEPVDVIDDLLHIGNLKYIDSSSLGSGDIIRVLPGFKMVHGICHLPRPSLAISIRRRSSKYNSAYDISGNVAMPTAATPGDVKNFVTLVAASHAFSAEKGMNSTLNILRSNPPYTNFVFLRRLGQLCVFSDEDYLKLLHQWGTCSKLNYKLSLSLLKQKRSQLFSLLWKYTQSLEQRFFLALVFLLPDRSTIKEAIKRLKKVDADGYISSQLKWPDGIFGSTMPPFVSEVAQSLYEFSGDTSKVYGNLSFEMQKIYDTQDFDEFCNVLVQSKCLEVLIDA